MSKGYAGAAVSANLVIPNTCTGISPACTTSVTIRAALREICPEKTWAYVADVLELKERAAKYRMTERSFTDDDIARLLWAADGHRLLAAIMARAPVRPLWWRICEPLFRLIALKRNQIAEEKELGEILKDLKDARTNLTAARQNVEAVVFQDPEFYGGQADAVRGMARESDRAVVATKRRK